MRIIEVSPMAKGISRETLSYFTAEEILPGAIVEVPVRNRNVSALVLSSRNAHDLKGEIKSASFTLKKLGKLKSSHFFLPSFIESASAIASYSASYTGAVLNALIPKAVLEFAEQSKAKKAIHEDTTAHLPEKYILQRCEEERYDAYKRLIREEFARKSSIFICLPTAEDAEKVYSLLKKGIENYTFVFHGQIKPKELVHSLGKMLKEEHAVLIIATGNFLSLPREDVATYIIEQESSRFYKMMSRPFLDIRLFAELFNSRRKKRLILADSLLRTETIWRMRQGEFAEFEPASFKVFDSLPPHVVDMKEYKESTKSFRVLSDVLIETIKQSLQNNENMFLFSLRRGLSPSVICGDCGTPVTCNECKTGMTLHQGSGSDSSIYFLCHQCGEKRSAEERCAVCGSWRLVMLGIGTELVEKEVLLLFPKATVFRFDRDTLKTRKQEADLIQKFYKTKGAILIGTEAAFSYLSEPIAHSAIISLDSLFSIPDFRIQERIMHTILKIRWLALSRSIVQTRCPENTVLQNAVRGNLVDFYKSEIALRETFGYPPFKTLIKISFEGKKAHLIEELTRLHELFKDYEFTVFPAFIKNGKGGFLTHLTIKIDSSLWPDQVLVSKLSSLPPSFIIKTDPDSMS